MCGIGGWLGRVETRDGTTEAVLASLAHRGPDGRAVKSWPDATLLHTRLRIIDLSPLGDQPMANEDGSVWIVFNGEIYNHHELRGQLEAKGHRFRGRCDAEVLPHLYEEHGAEMFARLRGMFAIAVFDERRRTLLLGRDRFGIKPLFYAATDEFVAFASEIRALSHVAGIDLAVDEQAVADFAALLFVPAPSTIHRGIRALAPGELIECELGADARVRARTRRYHAFEVGGHGEDDLALVADEAEEVLARAVTAQLESDVPLGAMLSGGVDSSLVSLFAARGVDELLTFNVQMPDPEYDETWAAHEASRAIGSRHRTLSLEGQGGSWDAVTAVLRQVGQPFADTSVFAVDAVSAAMRQHVTVALSGDGGDEGFGGYDAYWQLGTIERFRRLPVTVRRGLAGLLSPLARLRPVSQLSRRVSYVAEADDVGTVQALFSWIRPAEHARLLSGLDHVEPVRRLFAPQWDHSALTGSSRLERLSALAVEANVRLVLPNDFLVKVDTASMRHSLEVRVPMLDEDVIALGLSLPHSLRVEGRTGKRVLREVARRHLPASVVDRPKQGFSVPGDRWAGSAFRDNLREALLGADNALGGYLNRKVYEPWVQAFCNDESPSQISRGGLLQRVTMALALDLSLRSLPVPHRGA